MMAEPTDMCELTEMQIQGCDHCRRTGRYTPPAGTVRMGRNAGIRLTPELTLSMDSDGDVWIGPDETFRRMGRD